MLPTLFFWYFLILSLIFILFSQCWKVVWTWFKAPRMNIRFRRQKKLKKGNLEFQRKLEKHSQMISWCCKNVFCLASFSNFSFFPQNGKKPFYNFFHFFKKVSKNEAALFISTKKKQKIEKSGWKWRRRRLWLGEMIKMTAWDDSMIEHFYSFQKRRMI